MYTFCNDSPAKNLTILDTKVLFHQHTTLKNP